MMISPEAFYEYELKGKSQREIFRVIRSLKREINRLKRAVEETWLTEEMSELTMCPSPLTRIKCSKDYLKQAIQAYEETGEKYQPTKAEQKAMEFDRALESLCRLKFSIGGFFGGNETRTFTVSGNNVLLDVGLGPVPDSPNWPEYCPYTREEFISRLRDLLIGEWKKSYYNPCVCDGTQWELEIQYEDGRKPIRIYGSNAYPYNFDDLTELLGVELEEDAETEDKNK